jgi:large subunit ribosomal protein L4
MKLSVKDIQGNDASEFEVVFPLILDGRGTQAVHEVVTAYRANQRRGTACTKTMGEVTGTGKKPWRQKGTGRARAGSFQSPLWRGGGVVFGPKPRDYSKRVSKSVKALALQKALSARLHQGEVTVVNDLKLETPKTKEFLRVLSALNLEGTLLVVCEEPNDNLRLASRNVPGVELTTGRDLNTYQVLRYDRLLFTVSAFRKVEERLLK